MTVRAETQDERFPASKSIMFAGLLLTLSLFVFGFVWASEAHAAGTSYYIDNSSGSGCSDTNAGTSAASPWCDFKNFNNRSVKLYGGDKVLLKSGAVWNVNSAANNSFVPEGSTSSGSGYITVKTYGGNDFAYFTGNGSSGNFGVSITDTTSAYWDISMLDISGIDGGIRFVANSQNSTGLRIHDNHIHGLTTSNRSYGYAMIIWSPLTTPPAAPNTGMNQVEIFNNSIEHVNWGVSTACAYCGYSDPAYQTTPAFTNTHIHNNSILDVANQALVMWGTSDGVVIDNHIDTAGTAAAADGTTSFFMFGGHNNTVANNLFNYVPNTNSPDQTAIDFEAYNAGIQILYNYFSNTAGSGIEFLQLDPSLVTPLRDAGDYMTNNTVRGDAFVNNGGSSGSPASAIFTYTYDTTNHPLAGNIMNVLYTAPNLTAGSPNSLSSSGNLSVTSSGVYNSAYDFSSTAGTGGWTYEQHTASGYTLLSWDTAMAPNDNYQRYDLSSGSMIGYVSRFDMTPDNTSANWISRTWTSPDAGIVSIRSLVRKIDPNSTNSLSVRITHNGTTIWPSAGGSQTVLPGSNYYSDLDNVSVNAGDAIRFEVNNNGNVMAYNDAISWIPTIAFTSLLKNSGFETGSVSPWYIYGQGALAVAAVPHTGSYSGKASGRLNLWDSPGQDITTVLQSKGSGDYYLSAWLKLAAGSDTVWAGIKYTDSAGTHFVSPNGGVISGSGWTKVGGNVSVPITGSLTAANIFFQTNTSLADLYVDDADLVFVGANLAGNPGFETGSVSPWYVLGQGTLAVAAVSHTGSYSGKMSGRLNVWDSPGQGVTSALQANGAGNYVLTAWVKLASGSDGVQIIIQYTDSAGVHYVSPGATSANSSGWTKIGGIVNVPITGTLTAANIYFQTNSTLTDLYVDDVNLMKN